MHMSNEKIYFNLKDFEQFETIVIQCHDNPDADTIASGFALYSYLCQHNKHVRLIYTGALPITKPNLLLMLEKLEIPLEYIESLEKPDLLITVDCQVNGGNVTFLDAHNFAQLDHHIQTGLPLSLSCIKPALGSCSTLIWHLLTTHGFDCNTYPYVATALYYGLITDTNGLTELRHTLDKEMVTALDFDTTLIRMFKNSNLSMSDLETAGIALIRCSTNKLHKFAVLEAKPCDPNILGVISDLAIQVDNILVCLVFFEDDINIKFSVRSCIDSVKANEFAAYLCADLGSGGGHIDKAGGLMSSIAYRKRYVSTTVETYFHTKTQDFFDTL